MDVFGFVLWWRWDQKGSNEILLIEIDGREGIMVVCWMFGLMLTSNDVKDRQGDTIDNDIGSLSLFWSIHTLCSVLPFLSFNPLFLFSCFTYLEWNGTTHCACLTYSLLNSYSCHVYDSFTSTTNFVFKLIVHCTKPNNV